MGLTADLASQQEFKQGVYYWFTFKTITVGDLCIRNSSESMITLMKVDNLLMKNSSALMLEFSVDLP